MHAKSELELLKDISIKLKKWKAAWNKLDAAQTKLRNGDQHAHKEIEDAQKERIDASREYKNARLNLRIHSIRNKPRFTGVCIRHSRKNRNKQLSETDKQLSELKLQ